MSTSTPLTTPLTTSSTDDSSRRIEPSMTLGDIVTFNPSLAVELQRRGFDFCCHGGRTLSEAAGELGLEAATVAEELSAVRSDEPPADWAAMQPSELLDHIVAAHHEYLRDELPRINALVDKIVAVHGERHPELAEVQRLFVALRTDLEPHLVTEEQVVFPALRQIAAATAADEAPSAQLVEQIAELTDEHEVVGGLLEDLRRVTGGYLPPADGCATYAETYRALGALEADTHLHVHKESNVVIPALLPA
jgi:regulator of cell morphogenesis and NO signaling